MARTKIIFQGDSLPTATYGDMAAKFKDWIPACSTAGEPKTKALTAMSHEADSNL